MIYDELGGKKKCVIKRQVFTFFMILFTQKIIYFPKFREKPLNVFGAPHNHLYLLGKINDFLKECGEMIFFRKIYRPADIISLKQRNHYFKTF